MTFHFDADLAARLTDELPLLADVLGGHFNQDSYLFTSPDGLDRVGSDEEVFEEAVSLRNTAERAQLAQELATLLSREDRAVVSFWNRHASSHNFNYEDADDARVFLSKFRRYTEAGNDALYLSKDRKEE